MAITADQIARLFVMLESIDFAKMRAEFESASAWEKIAAGENALDIALDIVRHCVPLQATAANELETLLSVLIIAAQAAAKQRATAMPRSQKACGGLVMDPDSHLNFNEGNVRQASVKGRKAVQLH